MATAKRRSTAASLRFGRGWKIVFVIFALIAALAAYNWPAITGFTNAGSAYSARVACSCRYAGGRSLDDCRKDLLAGMELVSLSENEAEKSVTARYPLRPAQTARWRDGYGCVMDKWED